MRNVYSRLILLPDRELLALTQRDAWDEVEAKVWLQRRELMSEMVRVEWKKRGSE